MMSLDRVGWSSAITSSPFFLDLTAVDEAAREPLGPFVRLSKPSSL
jgi:hypothetical protein